MMNSEILTPSACSSSSARPVLREKASTPLIFFSRSITVSEISLDFRKDVPGGNTTFSWATPSLNGGKKSRSSCIRSNPAMITPAAPAINIGFASRILKLMA